MRRTSISRRLLLITIGVMTLTVALTGGLLLRQHLRQLQGEFSAGAVVLARAVADYSAGPLVFDDAAGALELLGKLDRTPFVARATLLDDEEKPLATYARAGAPPPTLPARQGPALEEGGELLHVFEPVLHKGARVGTLYLVASTAALRARAVQGTVTIGALVLVAVGLAALLAARLQRAVTRPLLRLAETMDAITDETVGSLRVEAGRHDEIGALYAGFNRMLDQLAERRRQREASEARLRALLAALPDPVFVVDEGARLVEILAAGPAGAPELREGASIAQALTPEAPALVEEAIGRAVTTGAPQRLAYERTTDGVQRSYDAILVPMPAEAETRVLCVPRDITERQTLESELRHAQKMDALGRLAGGVAHDFNNILTAILGYADLLTARMTREGHGAAVELGQEIRLAAERAAQLTRQLLAFSRRQVDSKQHVPFNALVANMLRMLERIIGDDIHLVAELGPDTAAVMADPGQLEQVVLNLVVNARDAMPNGGRLVLRTKRYVQSARRAGDPELLPGAYVVLEVQDTGTGIDPALRSRIFEPFFSTKEGSGTGLGLAMVYGIVRQAGGDILVDSEPGRGSLFRVFLPASEQTPPVKTAEAGPAAAPAGNETILLVEDEAQLRTLAERLLSMAGYRVLAAALPDEALALCRSHPGTIDLLLTDVVMPGMGGPSLARAARALRPGLRVLYMSGYTDDELMQRGVSLEALAFLPKPFTPAELQRKVRETLS
jgi:PAS domain S-box-containing protein